MSTDKQPKDAGSHNQKMTPALQAVIDASDKRMRDKAAMPLDCTSPTECRNHGCHGACLPTAPVADNTLPEPVAYIVTAPVDVGVGIDHEVCLRWIPGLPDEPSEPLYTADQLRAAIAAERHASAVWEKRARDYGWPDCGEQEVLREQIDALREQLAEATRDADRLTLLEGDAVARVFKIGKTWYWKPAYGYPHRKANTLRAAIDAAIAAKGEGA